MSSLPAKPTPLSGAKDLAEMRRRRRRALGLEVIGEKTAPPPRPSWRDRLPSRTVLIILGVVVAVHIAAFLLLRDTTVMEITRHMKIVVNFFVKDIPAQTAPDGTVVTPAERRYTVSTDTVEIPDQVAERPAETPSPAP